jgi:hypothetical protein
MIDAYIVKSAPAMMFGPQEVLVIVIVTAIVVFIVARDRRKGKR